MSTKTSFKRIALVAASALALGGFSVISATNAYALADEGANLSVFATSPTTATAVSGTATIEIFVGASTALTAAAGFTVIPTNTSRPAGSSAPTISLTSTGAAAPFATSGAAANTSVLTTSGAGLQSTAQGTSGGTLATVAGGVGTKIGTLTVTGFDAPGNYRVTVTPDGAGTDTAVVLTIPVGYSANSTYANKAFPTQGSNLTTGWAATAGGQATVRITGFANTTTYYVTTDTGSIISGTEGDAGTNIGAIANTNGTNLAGGFNFLTATAIASDYMDVKVTDLGAATTTVSVKSFNATTGVASTFVTATVTWGVSAAVSAQYSLLTLNDGAGTTATGAAADTTSTTVAKTAGVNKFTIQVVTKDQYNVAITGLTLGASISGPGTIGIAATSTAAASAGRSLTVALTGVSTGSVSVYGDGISGASTITITATNSAGVTTTLGSKTVTFVGSASKAVATQALKVAKAATQLGATGTGTAAAGTSMTTTPAFSVEVMDSNGNDVAAGATVKMTSSDATVITVGTCVEITLSPGNFECSVSGATAAVSGKSATVTFSVYSAATGLYDILANALTFSIGGSIASVAVTTDKAAYTNGEAIVLTATAKDSSGNAAYDGQTPYQTIASNKSLITLPATTTYIVGGVAATSATTPTLFAPATSGDFTISGLTIATVAAPLGAAYSVTGSVEKDQDASLALDAANAATDAANNAYDEAQNATQAASDALAAVTALAAQVKSLIASVKKLTAAVAKLKK